MKTHTRSFVLAMALCVSALAFAAPATSANATGAAKPNIVLVHGAFADASSWSRLIPLLQKDGYNVTAVQIPLSSLEDDIAATKRALQMQKGPVILVGHSYGGAVISGAAAGNPNVKGLVYVSAFAPDKGEDLTTLQKKFSAPELASALQPDSGGFLYVDRSKFRSAFAADVPESETRVFAVTQKPLHQSAFTAKLSEDAAWKNVPTSFIVASEDHAINPDLERFFAKRMGAKVTEVKSSHVPFLSHPNVVANVIEQAANAQPRAQGRAQPDAR